MQALARAKLNLFLHVIGKREDGYHDLATQVVFTDFGDVLTFEKSDLLTLSVDGEFAEECKGADNLVLQAARALQAYAETRQGARIHLIKHIPVGAGLGGGSADAAATLRALNALWELGLDEDELADIGLELGADVPMCVYNRPLYATGIGEQMHLVEGNEPWPIWIVLVYPRVPVITANVFAQLTEEEVMRRRFGEVQILFNHLHETGNDLQRAAIAVSPMIGEVLLAMETQLPQPNTVRMTGSGSCCFAIFLEEAEAQRYATAMQRDYPKWWVKLTRADS